MRILKSLKTVLYITVFCHQVITKMAEVFGYIALFLVCISPFAGAIYNALFVPEKADGEWRP
jgi:hypothetical protein